MFSMALDRRTLWMALFAGVMLVFLVLLVQRYQSASAQDAAIEYAENDTGAGGDFHGDGPRGAAGLLVGVAGRCYRDPIDDVADRRCMPTPIIS